MAIYSRRVRTERHIEYTIPAPAAHVEVDKAWHAAMSEYRTVHGLPADRGLSDDALWFVPGDDEIVIRFTASSTEGN